MGPATQENITISKILEQSSRFIIYLNIKAFPGEKTKLNESIPIRQDELSTTLNKIHKTFQKKIEFIDSVVKNALADVFKGENHKIELLFNESVFNITEVAFETNDGSIIKRLKPHFKDFTVTDYYLSEVDGYCNMAIGILKKGNSLNKENLEFIKSEIVKIIKTSVSQASQAKEQIGDAKGCIKKIDNLIAQLK